MAGGLREDFHQRPGATRGVERAGGLREDFHQRAEAARLYLDFFSQLIDRKKKCGGPWFKDRHWWLER